MSNVRGLIRNLKNVVVQYEPIEIKVREATSNDSWGAKTTLMAEIARSTHDHKEYNKLFAMLWKRLKDDANVLHVQKAMILIEYLLRNGSDRFIRDVKDRIDAIDRRKRYQARSTKLEDVDRARQVRRKAAALIALISDEKRLNKERVTAERIKNVKNSAVSSDGRQTGGFGGDVSADKLYGEANGERKKKEKSNDFGNEFDEDPFKEKPKKKKAKDPFDDEDGFQDDPFAEAQPKKKSNGFDNDPFADATTKQNDDPFADAAKPKKSADPFGDFESTPAPAPKKKGKKKKKKKKKQQEPDPFANGTSDPFGAELAPVQEAAPQATNGGGLSSLFDLVNNDTPAPAQTAPQSAEQPTIDFLSGGFVSPVNENSYNGVGSFATKPEHKKKDTISGMVNLDNIMAKKQPVPQPKTSMISMQQSNIDVNFQSGPGPMGQQPAQTQNGGVVDAFFDKKENALADMFGSSPSNPQVMQQQRQMPQQRVNPQMQMGYGGYPAQQGYGMQRQYQQQYAQPNQGYNPYAQQPNMNMMGGMNGSNPFMQTNMGMGMQQPAPQQSRQPQQQPQQDAFNGLSW
mmetsp:Transcript_34642/g.83821  ORF Transcript_34642/g.83821 Transcript_34642/m.83821 type:complete len:572 (+) Transcript_34642:294-2009(+)